MAQSLPGGMLELNAVIAVDVVLFSVRATESIEEAWQVLLVQRDDVAFTGKLALPGVLVRADETFDAAGVAHKGRPGRGGLVSGAVGHLWGARA